MTKKQPTTTRRHIIACAAALAPAGALAAVPAPGANDAELRRLFEEWGPLNAAYVAANEAVADAEAQYCAGKRELSERAKIAQRAAGIAENVNTRKDEPFKGCKGEMLKGLDIPADCYGPENGDLAQSLRDYFGAHIRADETIADFLREADAEVLEAQSHNAALHERLKTAELEDAARVALRAESAAVARIAATPAQTLAGLTMKATVWEKYATDDLTFSVMNDARRLGGVPEIPVDRFQELFV